MKDEKPVVDPELVQEIIKDGAFVSTTFFAQARRAIDLHREIGKAMGIPADDPVMMENLAREELRDTEQLPPVDVLLAAIDNALRNGSYMTGANLALDLLCDGLGVNRDTLEFDPRWPGKHNPAIRCAHCRGAALGYATVGQRRLCHPNEGLDCYHLVTVYKHPLPCDTCVQERQARDKSE